MVLLRRKDRLGGGRKGPARTVWGVLGAALVLGGLMLGLAAWRSGGPQAMREIAVELPAGPAKVKP